MVNFKYTVVSGARGVSNVYCGNRVVKEYSI